MQKLNIGIIGLGYIGKTHIYNCMRLENANLVAVADISKNALTKAKRIGVPNTYNDYQELLNNPQIDAVIIALPTHLHAKCAIGAAEAHKHILLEKPISRNTVEATEILSKVRSNGVKIMIGLMPVFAIAAFFEGYITRLYNDASVFTTIIMALSVIFVAWYFIIYPVRLGRKLSVQLNEEEV